MNQLTHHVGSTLIRESRQLLLARHIRRSLQPRLPILLQLILDPYLLASAHNTGGSIKLAKRAEERAADAPLSRLGATSAVVRPGLQRRLHKMTGTV